MRHPSPATSSARITTGPTWPASAASVSSNGHGRRLHSALRALGRPRTSDSPHRWRDHPLPLRRPNVVDRVQICNIKVPIFYITARARLAWAHAWRHAGGTWNRSTSRASERRPRAAASTERQPLADDVHDVLVDMLMNHTLGPGSRLNIDAARQDARRVTHPGARSAGAHRGRGPDRQGAPTRIPRRAADQPRRPALADRLPAADRTGSSGAAATRRHTRSRPPTSRSWPAVGEPTTATIRLSTGAACSTTPRFTTLSPALGRQPVAARVAGTAAQPPAHVPAVLPRPARRGDQRRARCHRRRHRQRATPSGSRARCETISTPPSGASTTCSPRERTATMPTWPVTALPVGPDAGSSACR